MRMNAIKLIFPVLLVFYAGIAAGQISDLRGGGAITVATSRMHGYVDGFNALFGNSAAITTSNKTMGVFAGGMLRYNDDALGEYSLGAVKKIGGQYIGAAFTQLGTSGYFERKIQVTLARRLNKVFSIGTNLQMYHFQITEFGSTFSPSFDLYSYSEVTKELSFGIVAKNLFTVSKEQVSYPSLIALSAFYQPSEQAQVGVEVSKYIDRPIDARLVVRYKPAAQLDIIFGSNVSNQQMSFGLNYRFGSSSLTTAYGYHSQLPPSYGFSLGYER